MGGRRAGAAGTGAAGSAGAGFGSPRAASAWPVDVAAEGEDDLDAFPLPPEARTEELASIAAASGVAEVATPPVPVETTPEVPQFDDDEVLPADPDEAIRRFHQRLGLVPAEPAAVVPATAETVETVEVAEGGGDDAGGGGGGGDAGTGGGGGGGDGGRRNRFQLVDKPMTIYEHLDELRRRIMWAGLAFVVGMAAVLPFYNPILAFFEHGYHTQALTPMEELYAVMRVVVLVGLVVASPVILYQAIAYVLPALTPKERRLLFSYLPAATALLIAGCCFALFILEPILLKMASNMVHGVTFDPSINSVIDFGVGYALPFGLLFELPIVIAVLVALGIVTPELLTRNRRWAVLAIVVVAEMVTPPADIIVTPTIVFVPLYGLYELSILVARRAYRRYRQQQDQIDV